MPEPAYDDTLYASDLTTQATAATVVADATAGLGTRLAAFLIAGGLLLAVSAVRAEETEAAKEASVKAKTVLSPVYEVDRIYRSMKGPQSQQKIVLGDQNEPELIWITGYKAVMVGPDGESVKPQQFMCHSNLDIDVTRHRAMLSIRVSSPFPRVSSTSIFRPASASRWSRASPSP